VATYLALRAIRIKPVRLNVVSVVISSATSNIYEIAPIHCNTEGYRVRLFIIYYFWLTIAPVAKMALVTQWMTLPVTTLLDYLARSIREVRTFNPVNDGVGYCNLSL
tara:strand:+ start:131 stop:451 length:321 start_codon:yes stop_codon:yes gene_type:complete